MSIESADIEKRLGKAENRITALETAQPYLKDVLERNTKAYESVVSAVHDIKETLCTMNDKIAVQDKQISSVQNDITEIRKKVEEEEDKGKFDIMGFLKQYFPWIIVGIGIVYEIASNYIKF